jgi:cytochrome P450
MLLVAGSDPISHTLSMMLALIAGHPEVQRQIDEELGRHSLLVTPGGPTPRVPTGS